MAMHDGLNRRNFLRSVAAAAVTAHVGLSGAAAQDEGGDAEPFNFGVIGCGGQGRVLMAAASGERIPGVKFAAVTDIRPYNLAEGAKLAGEGVTEFTDYRELLSQADALGLHGVIVATPLVTHKDIVIACFEAGLPVFCEKCMALTVDDCKEMIRAQLKANKVLQIGHHLRYHPLYHHAKKAFVGEGLVGDVTSIYAQWNRNHPWRRQVPEQDTNVDYEQWGFASADELVNWRLYSHLSGGLMTELASHQIDVMNWMLDKTPRAVMGMGGIDYYNDGRTVPDHVHVMYEYPGDEDNEPAAVRFDYQSITTNAFSSFGSECFEMIRGTKGTLVLTHLLGGPTKSKGWFFLEPGVQKELWMDLAHKEESQGREAIILDVTVTEGTPIAGQPYDQLMTKEGELRKLTYTLELEEFINSARNNKSPMCDGLKGMQSAAAALMGNQSIVEGAKIEFADDLYQL